MTEPEQPKAMPGHIHTAELYCTRVCPGWRLHHPIPPPPVNPAQTDHPGLSQRVAEALEARGGCLAHGRLVRWTLVPGWWIHADDYGVCSGCQDAPPPLALDNVVPPDNPAPTLQGDMITKRWRYK